MHQSVMTFGGTELTEDICAGALVLEVGSMNVNGSLRDHVMRHKPRWYVATDMQPGPGVDLPIRAEYLHEIFTPGAFDLVICTEMLEHAQQWHTALRRIVSMLDLSGRLLLTTRSPGFPLHGFPDDHWRFELDPLCGELRNLGMVIERGIDDPEAPGVLILAKRVYNIQHLSHVQPVYTNHPHPMKG